MIVGEGLPIAGIEIAKKLVGSGQERPGAISNSNRAAGRRGKSNALSHLSDRQCRVLLQNL
jgi:hypothetical protein